MTRIKTPKECKVAEERLTIACDAAGLFPMMKTYTRTGRKTKIMGSDHCDYPVYGSPEFLEMMRAESIGESTPGKPVVRANVVIRCFNGSPKLHAFVEVTKDSTVGNTDIFKPRNAEGLYKYNYEGEKLWKNVAALAKKEKLIGSITEKTASEILGIEGLKRESGRGIANGYIYGYNRYSGYFPVFKDKREAVSFGKQWKENIDAFVKKVS